MNSRPSAAMHMSGALGPVSAVTWAVEEALPRRAWKSPRVAGSQFTRRVGGPRSPS